MTDSGPYGEQTRVRSLIAIIDRDISELPKKAAADDLAMSWAALVALLAVGPEPDVRRCPYCDHLVMRTATRCRDCWRKLTPPDK
jgi:hypothetical protein